MSFEQKSYANFRWSRKLLPFQWQLSSQDVQVTIEVRQWELLIAWLAVLAWVIVAPTGIGEMALTGLSGILIAAMLWVEALIFRVDGKRELASSVMQLGDELEEEISLSNRSILPVLWAEFVDRANMPGYLVSSVRAVDGTTINRWRVRSVCTQRGLFTLGPWELRLGDPFGIFHIQKVYTAPQEVLVYPPLAALPPQFLPRGKMIGDRRSLSIPASAETLNATTTRPYFTGDPFRKIHWRTTARRGVPFVRVFEPEAASRIWLVPDFSYSAHLGIGNRSTEEDMVILTATLAAELLHQGMQVGLYAETNQPHLLLPQRGEGHLWAVLKTITPLFRTQDSRLDRTLAALGMLLSMQDLVILVTPSNDTSWVSSARQVLRRRGGMLVLLLDRSSYGGGEHIEDQVAVLLETGISSMIIRKEDIRPLEEVYGRPSRWEFKILGTGKAIARQKPRGTFIFAHQSGIQAGTSNRHEEPEWNG